MTEPIDEEQDGTPESIFVQDSAEIPAVVEFAIPAPAYSCIATDPDPDPNSDGQSDLMTPTSSQAVDLSPALLAIADLDRKLDMLGVAFDREIRAEATREKIVDRLHAELQEYKQGLILSLMKPVFLDLIQLHDDVGKTLASTTDGAAVSSLTDVRQSLEDILYRQGVEPYWAEGDDFDARRQRVVSTVATDDPDQARKIASRLRAGFAAGDRVIRPEIVTVFAVRRS